jgi:hypothetical protein
MLRAGVRATTAFVRVGRTASIDGANAAAPQRLRQHDERAPPSSAEKAEPPAPPTASANQAARRITARAPLLQATPALRPPPRAAEVPVAESSSADAQPPSVRAAVAPRRPATRAARPRVTVAMPRADHGPIVRAAEDERSVSLRVGALPPDATPTDARQPAPSAAAVAPGAARTHVLGAPTPLPASVFRSREAAPSTSFAVGTWPSLPDEPDVASPSHWPALPEDGPERHAPLASGELAYDRSIRLRREQRGAPWSG